MSVQLIDLEEVQMIEVSDNDLEARGAAGLYTTRLVTYC